LIRFFAEPRIGFSGQFARNRSLL